MEEVVELLALAVAQGKEFLVLLEDLAAEGEVLGIVGAAAALVAEGDELAGGDLHDHVRNRLERHEKG